MIKVIVAGLPGQHSDDVKTAILSGAGNSLQEDEITIMDYYAALIYAWTNQSVIAIVQSTSGVQGFVADAQKLYDHVQFFMPLGGNQNVFALVEVFTDPVPPVIVICGAGDFTDPATDKNNTSYGNGLEFWDHDLVIDDVQDGSSFSNGIIAGKLLLIKTILDCSWWESRYRARMTADRNEDNRESSPWDLRNGYGRINTAAAIAYGGEISTDPYLTIPIEPVVTTGCYISEKDLTAYIPAEELARLTTEIDQTTKETNIQRIIKNVCSFADTFIQNKYDIPLAVGLITAALNDALCKLVIWRLSSTYTNLDDQTYKIRLKDNDDAITFLQGIAKGDKKLDNTNVSDELKNSDKYHFDSDQRIDNRTWH